MVTKNSTCIAKVQNIMLFTYVWISKQRKCLKFSLCWTSVELLQILKSKTYIWRFMLFMFYKDSENLMKNTRYYKWGQTVMLFRTKRLQKKSRLWKKLLDVAWSLVELVICSCNFKQRRYEYKTWISRLLYVIVPYQNQ